MAENANQAPAVRGGARGGRGGGRGKPAPRSTGSASLASKSKVGPTRVLDADWAEESSLKGKTFVVWVGGGQTAPRQYTFHHPIGETNMDDRQWVATPTDEIRYLLERRKSEALSRWEREKSLALRAQVLAAGTGRRLNNGVTPPTEEWTHDGAPPIAATIRIAMAAAKAAGVAESEWVNHTDPAVRASELQFKQALTSATLAPNWAVEHPRPVFTTLGGPLGDRPQLAVGYLGTSSLAAAKDLVLSRLTSVVAMPPVVLPGGVPLPPTQ